MTLSQLVRFIRRGERNYSPLAYLSGYLLHRRFTAAGAVAAPRGWPLPRVEAGNGTIEAGHVGLYPGVLLTCLGRGRISVGDGSYLNRCTRVYAGREVRIGRNCMIAWENVITDTDGVSFDVRAVQGPLVIGDQVWIGARCVIAGALTIGNGAIVAANSLVTSDVPARAVVAGRPAKVLTDEQAGR